MKVLGLNTKVGQRFLAILLSISLVPLAFVGGLAIRTAESTLGQQTHSTLRAASDGAEAQLREFLSDFKKHMVILSEDENIRRALESISSSSSFSPLASPSLDDFLLDQRQRIPEVQELFIVGPDGTVIGSSDQPRSSQNLSDADYFVRGQEGFFGGDVFKEKDGGLTWIMTLPIHSSASQRLLGVLAFRINPRLLSDLTTGRRVLAEGADTQTFRIGDSGETYIVNRNHLMITESRHISNSVLNVKVDTFPVRVAFDQGHEITGDYQDYRGTEVSGASIILRNLGWVVITEVDFRQAFGPVQRLRRGLLGATIGMALLVIFLAWNSTWRIVRPIQILSESDRALAAGNEAAAEVSEEGLPRDELGELVRQRNTRIKAMFAYQRELEERTAKLKEAVGELEQMSYSIMHDMRAPLRALVGFGSLLLDEEAERLSPKGQEHLHRIKAAAIRMDQFIRDVLNYSVIARAELPLCPVNVPAIVDGILESYPTFRESRAQIRVQPDLPAVQGNEAALTQCFANLLDNAMKFAAPGKSPQVQIRGEPVDGRVRIWVEDNGVGIPEAMRERIFRIFERGSNVGDSTGIGLAIVRKAVERMGGQTGVISAPGQGSRFWIELQRAN